MKKSEYECREQTQGQGSGAGGGQSYSGEAEGPIEADSGGVGVESVPSGGGVGGSSPHVESVGELPISAGAVLFEAPPRVVGTHDGAAWERYMRLTDLADGWRGSDSVRAALRRRAWRAFEMSREVRPVLPVATVETGAEVVSHRREKGKGSRSIIHNGVAVSSAKMWLFLGEQMWLHPFPEEERAVIDRAAAMSKRAPGVRAHTVVSWLAWAVRYGAFGGGVGQVKAWREDSTSCLEVCWRYCLVKALEELAESEAVEGDEISKQTRKVFQDVNKLAAIRKGRKHHLHKPGGDVYMMLEAATVRTLDMAAEHIHRLSGGALFSDRGHNAHANMILRAALEALVVRDEITWPPRFLAGFLDPDLEAAEDLIRGLGEGGGL